MAYLPWAYDVSTDTNKSIVQNPNPSYYASFPIDDSTNNAAGTFYYPSALWDTMDGSKFLSVEYTGIDADGTITISVEATNISNPVTWDFKQIFWSGDTVDARANSWTVTGWTLSLLVSFKEFNFTNYRVKVVFSWSTNSSKLDVRKVY